jgi:hypothetical protein
MSGSACPSAGLRMSASWFTRSHRRQAADIRPGNRYRRRLGKCLAATATVLELRPDLVGIPHVQFAVTVDGSSARLSEGDTRVLALQSFLDTYRERLAQEIQPEPSGAAGATVIRLLPRPLPS